MAPAPSTFERLRFKTSGVTDSTIKLYAFDGISSELELIPLAARRALDAVGRKLSLKAFLTLPLDTRRELVACGCDEKVDLALAKQIVELAEPEAPKLEVPPPISEERVPLRVRASLGDHRPLTDKVWQGLSSLDRYALYKVAEKNRPERVEAAYREIIGATALSTHLRPQGGVRMVSVAKKPESERYAQAECWLSMSPAAFEALSSNTAPKGDVFATARLAGIMACKKASDLIPLCHPLPLQHAEVDFQLSPPHRVRVSCRTIVFARTGVEMEAMVGANLAALTIYDMLKSIDRSMSIGGCRLIEKRGGRSGDYHASSSFSESDEDPESDRDTDIDAQPAQPSLDFIEAKTSLDAPESDTTVEDRITLSGSQLPPQFEGN